jgi:hypothetical protein
LPSKCGVAYVSQSGQALWTQLNWGTSVGRWIEMGPPFHDFCSTDNTILLVGLLAGFNSISWIWGYITSYNRFILILFFLGLAFPFGSRPLSHEHKCEVN